MRAPERENPFIRVNLPLLTAKWSILEFQNHRHATRIGGMQRRAAGVSKEGAECARNGMSSYVYLLSAGVTYRVAEMQRLVSHPLLRPRAVRLPVDENLQAIALKWKPDILSNRCTEGRR
jgi:hypothetical protein